MPSNTPALGITEVVLRDAHQSLFATRMRIDDMLPIAEKLDQIGYWSMESWGGATFDSTLNSSVMESLLLRVEDQLLGNKVPRHIKG